MINDAIIVDALVSVTPRSQQHSAAPAEFTSARHPIRQTEKKKTSVAVLIADTDAYQSSNSNSPTTVT